ncbi:MAG: hypothetical protein P8Z76_15015, partial [Alphaproteobacteria bacterium]
LSPSGTRQSATGKHQLTLEGIKAVASWEDDHYEGLEAKIDFSAPFEAPVEEEESATDDDEWEPIPLERSGVAFEQAIEEVETAVGVIEGDNGYAANEPEERAQVLWSLKSGLDALRNGLPDRSQVIDLVVKPLKYLAKKFGDAAIGATAKSAATAVIKWLFGG